ncbi:hypothetical protein Pth03_19510 [Planotetraspora thailandica]|uniref:Uncharacterized protein n=1 Tax=Planotetraspora thailandica TaxID=487172 RepID=A0A8J3V119_9ACTN|nr:hypothetical protein Pth03_19510 [Planotetraspora thailandica]
MGVVRWKGTFPTITCGCRGKAEPQHVGVDDGDIAGCAPGQPACPLGVDLHGRHRPAVPAERDRQGAVARADLDDGARRTGDQFFDGGDDGAVDEEVLTELVPSALIGVMHGMRSAWAQVEPGGTKHRTGE